MAKIQKASRFGEALGKGTFKGAAEVEVSISRSFTSSYRMLTHTLQAREGPVQFEKDAGDPFNVDKFLSEVDQGSSSKRGYGLQDEDSRQSKRPRVDDDDED
jgi:SNW domain-containing protein 1